MVNDCRQATIAQELYFEGVGLHGGQPTSVTLKPLGIDKGIVIAQGGRVLGRIRDARITGDSRCTQAQFSAGSVETVEHLLAALYCLGITNVLIDSQTDELPILDGSSMLFAQSLYSQRAPQSAPRATYKLCESVYVCARHSSILMLPSRSTRVHYVLDYVNGPIRAMTQSVDISPENFLSFIAPARTFCTEDEVASILTAGLAKGADSSNCVVVGSQGPASGSYRLENECARHKILDILGDLAVLEMYVPADIYAIRSGHMLNKKLCDAIKHRRGE